MQAYIDDSGSDPRSLAFVLAGFVASQSQWAAFSDEWKKALNRPPRLSYFKNNEAMALKGQFDKSHGWTEQNRNDRMVALAQVIRKHIPERFSVALRNEDYYRYMEGIPVQKRMKTLENPYFMLFHEFMLIVASVHSIDTKIVPCEFVFDDQGKMGKRAAAWWPTFSNSLRTAAKFDFSPYFTTTPPIFKRDIECLPLQAADLYAGQLNRAMASDKIIIPPSPALRTLMLISGYHRVLDRKYFAPLRANFLAMAKRIEADKPGSLPHAVGRTRKKQGKKRADAETQHDRLETHPRRT